MTRRATVVALVLLVGLTALGYWVLGQVFVLHGLSAGGSDEGAGAPGLRAAAALLGV